MSHWLDVYFLTCMVTNNSRYDGNNCLVSTMYNMTNGVKQGAVLSPILFTMYIDGLFYERVLGVI